MRLIDADVAIEVVHKWLEDVFCISSTADEVTVFKRLRAVPTVDAVPLDTLKDKDKIIAALQCALDQANEKLAYVSGEECYHYDCEAGRKQLEAWWAAVKHEEQEPIKPLITGHGEFETEGTWWYECGNCGTAIDPDDKFCRKCGKAVKWDG